ncbi:MAG TPA: hypothetical protein VJH68_05040, partial [Candidatus Nanoarchaeia archaeon]|nr:hypothetical protein [Candidatus Nanoarchaeia archaeon]
AGGTTAGLRRESFIPGSVRYQSRNIDTFENTVYDTCSGTSSVREYWCGGLSDNLQLYNDIVICSNGCVYGASGSYCRR